MTGRTYLDLFESTNWDEISKLIEGVTAQDVELALARQGQGGLFDFASLISPIAAETYLEEMAQLSSRLTQKRFGRAVRLFAPLYLSNECNNVCDYCGFSLENEIPRKTLSKAEILKEAGELRKMGFQHILLVTGESSKDVGVRYIAEALKTLRPYFSNLSMEVQPLSQEEYEELIKEGLHSVLVYQETYNQVSYLKHHRKGKKRNFEWRAQTPDRLGSSKINKIGLGCLYGLTNEWRTDAYFAAQHLEHLEKKYWQTTYSMSFPRLRPCEGQIEPEAVLSDRDLVQLICAFRIFSHELELSISTRESSSLRDNLLPLGITTLSAGSKTNPGGYSVAPNTLEQFEISDERSPAEICSSIKSQNYDPVWKDWDSSYDARDSSMPSPSLTGTEGLSIGSEA